MIANSYIGPFYIELQPDGTHRLVICTDGMKFTVVVAEYKEPDAAEAV